MSETEINASTAAELYTKTHSKLQKIQSDSILKNETERLPHCLKYLQSQLYSSVLKGNRPAKFYLFQSGQTIYDYNVCAKFTKIDLHSRVENMLTSNGYGFKRITDYSGQIEGYEASY